MSAYARICLYKQDSEYARVRNILDLVYSPGSLYKVVRQVRWNFVEVQLYPLTNFVKPCILDV